MGLITGKYTYINAHNKHIHTRVVKHTWWNVSRNICVLVATHTQHNYRLHSRTGEGVTNLWFLIIVDVRIVDLHNAYSMRYLGVYVILDVDTVVLCISAHAYP